MHAVETEVAEMIGVSRSTIQKWCQGQIPQNFEPHLIEELALYAARQGRVNREWAVSLLHHVRYAGSGSYSSRDAFLDTLFPGEQPYRPGVFLCVQRDAEPDSTLSLQISNALTEQCNVFRDHAYSVDTDQDWAERIESQLHQSDYLILFLSAESVQSEVVLAQLDVAQSLRRHNTRGPQLLPVRLRYKQPFTGTLSTYLDDLPWAYWDGEQETGALTDALLEAIFGGELPLDEEGRAALLREAEVETPTPRQYALALRRPLLTEALPLHTTVYVPRDSDRVALEAIVQPGATIPIKGPRQMGKSSLLIRLAHAAQEAGKQVCILDFHLLRPHLGDADTFFREFCIWLADSLDLADQTGGYWTSPAPNPRRCTNYVGREVLERLDRPLALLIDNADLIFDSDFHVTFFAMLRSWHNLRSYEPLWENLDLVLATSTEPLSFISNVNQSPFNVGEVIELTDFDDQQVRQLNALYDAPLSDKEIEALMALLHGQPYLVHRAIYFVASGRISATELFAAATNERGMVFGDHLRSLLLRQLYGETQLVAGLREVIQTGRLADKDTFFRLRGAGLVRREGNDIVPRCQLYADFFHQHFHE